MKYTDKQNIYEGHEILKAWISLSKLTSMQHPESVAREMQVTEFGKPWLQVEFKGYVNVCRGKPLTPLEKDAYYYKMSQLFRVWSQQTCYCSMCSWIIQNIHPSTLQTTMLEWWTLSQHLGQVHRSTQTLFTYHACFWTVGKTKSPS